MEQWPDLASNYGYRVIQRGSVFVPQVNDGEAWGDLYIFRFWKHSYATQKEAQDVVDRAVLRNARNERVVYTRGDV